MTNLNLAFDIAEQHLDIPKMLDAEGKNAIDGSMSDDTDDFSDIDASRVYFAVFYVCFSRFDWSGKTRWKSYYDLRIMLLSCIQWSTKGKYRRPFNNSLSMRVRVYFMNFGIFECFFDVIFGFFVILVWFFCLLDLVEVAKPDERSIMTYVAAFYHAFAGDQKVKTTHSFTANLLFTAFIYSV